MRFDWQNDPREIKGLRSHNTKDFPHPTESGKRIRIESSGLLHAFTDIGFEDIPDYSFPEGKELKEKQLRHFIMDLPDWGEAKVEDDGKVVRVLDELGVSIFRYSNPIAVEKGKAPFKVVKDGKKVRDAFSAREELAVDEKIDNSEAVDEGTYEVEDKKLYLILTSPLKNQYPLQAYDDTDTASTNNKDSDIWEGAPTAKKGAQTYGYVREVDDGNTIRSLFDWTLSVDPGGTEISTIKLYLNVQGIYDSYNAATAIHELTETFVEAEVTWDRRSDANAWTNAGGTYDGTIVDEIVVSATGWNAWILSGTGSDNPIAGLTWESAVDLLLKEKTQGSDSAKFFRWHTKEHATGANHPYIEITYALTDKTSSDTGAGVEAIIGRGIVLPETGAGAESLGSRALVIAETGAGLEALVSTSPLRFRIKIGGNILTDSVPRDSVRIESVITRRIDTCKLIVRDTTGSISINPKDDIIISDHPETTRYFAGKIARVKVDIEGITKMFVCTAQDYTILAEKIIVNEIYVDKTDAYIFNDLCTSYRSDLDGSTHVQTGQTHSRIVFNRVTLREAFDRLTAESGFDWYIDYFKRVHYFAPATNSAPFGLSDDPDESATFPYSELKYVKEATRLVNMAQVIGGTYLSDDTSFELPSDAQRTELLMPYKMHAPVGESALSVYYNNNTDENPDWVGYTMGVDFLDEFNAINCLHNYQEKLLKFSAAPPDLKRSVKVTGRYDVPIQVRVRQEASYAQYGEWYEEKIINKDIDNIAWAKLEGKALLAEHAFEKERGSLVCIRDGLTSGQSVCIVNALQGIDEHYTINKLTTRLLGYTTVQYTVNFGEYNPDLIDLIIATKAQATQYQETREDETLIELLEQFEELTLSEATDRHEDEPPMSRWIAEPPTQGAGHHIRHELLSLAEATSRWEQLKGQYCWAPKSNGAGLREAVWDKFSWG